MGYRVAFLLNRFPVLSESFVSDQVAGLLARGVAVDVWADPGDGVASPLEHPGLTVRRWPRPGFSSWATMARVGPRRFLAGYRAASRLPVPRPGQVAARVGALRGSPPYDLVVAHFGPQGLVGQLYREQGVLHGPLAVFFHGFDMSSFVARNGERVYRDLLAKLDWALPVSERWRQRLLGLGAPASRTRVHRMGVDLDRIPFSPRWWRPGEPLRVVTVGRLVEKKGIHVAIPAMAKLAAEVPGLEWDVIGGGALQAELESAARQAGAPARFHGPLPRDAVAVLRAQAHLLLAPSLTARSGDQEGIPLVLMEAMAHGRMVVSTYHSGIPELVRSGVTGYLAEEGDAESLLTALRAAVARRSEWPGQLAAARRRVESAFSRSAWDERLFRLVEASAGRAG